MSVKTINLHEESKHIARFVGINLCKGEILEYFKECGASSLQLVNTHYKTVGLVSGLLLKNMKRFELKDCSVIGKDAESGRLVIMVTGCVPKEEQKWH